MHENILLKQIFGKNTLKDVPVDALEQLVQQYPFFAAGHLLLAKKQFASPAPADEMKTGENDPLIRKAILYTGDPFLVEQFLTPAANQAPPPAPEPPPPPDTVEDNDLIQPLFTTDYFASQGIRLSDTANDNKRPTMAQLRSFTDWLRTTRRPRPATDPDKDASGKEMIAAIYENEEDAAMTSEVEKMAIDSVRAGEEVMTEAMAEVWVKQGQVSKAVHIYEKLGLLNPEKSSYFAGKIAEIKHSNS